LGGTLLAGTTPCGAFLAGNTPCGAFLAGNTPYGAFLAGNMPYGSAADVGTGVLDISDIAVSIRTITGSARYCRYAVSGLGAAGHEVLSSDYSGQ
jgi:hypothetical protein